MADKLYIAGADTSTLQQGEQQLASSLKSASATKGIVSQTPSKKAIEELKSKFKEYDQKENTLGNQLYTIYTAANYRDARYCVVGRKYMRLLGVQGKLAAFQDRFQVISSLPK